MTKWREGAPGTTATFLAVSSPVTYREGCLFSGLSTQVKGPLLIVNLMREAQGEAGIPG